MYKRYQNLEMWQRAQNLCLQLFKVTKGLPPWERGSLYARLRENAELVPLKIADGATSVFMNEYVSHLRESCRLLVIIKSEILIIRYLEYATGEITRKLEFDIDELIQLIRCMIRRLEYQKEALHPAFAYLFPPAIRN